MRYRLRCRIREHPVARTPTSDRRGDDPGRLVAGLVWVCRPLCSSQVCCEGPTGLLGVRYRRGPSAALLGRCSGPVQGRAFLDVSGCFSFDSDCSFVIAVVDLNVRCRSGEAIAVRGYEFELLSHFDVAAFETADDQRVAPRGSCESRGRGEFEISHRRSSSLHGFAEDAQVGCLAFERLRVAVCCPAFVLLDGWFVCGRPRLPLGGSIRVRGRHETSPLLRVPGRWVAPGGCVGWSPRGARRGGAGWSGVTALRARSRGVAGVPDVGPHGTVVWQAVPGEGPAGFGAVARGKMYPVVGPSRHGRDSGKWVQFSNDGSAGDWWVCGPGPGRCQAVACWSRGRAGLARDSIPQP